MDTVRCWVQGLRNSLLQPRSVPRKMPSGIRCWTHGLFHHEARCVVLGDSKCLNYGYGTCGPATSNETSKDMARWTSKQY